MYLSLSDRPTTVKSTMRGRIRVSRLVVTLGVVSLLTDISSESVSAILPLYLTAVIGLGTVAYGFVDGLYQGVSALVRIAGGWVADRSGRPQRVALAGYGLSMVARVLLLFAGGVASISAVISADRIGKGLRTAPRDSMITAASDPAHLGRSFGVHRTLDTVGAAIGPLLAFGILWAIPDGYHTVLVVSLGFAVLGVVVLALYVPRDAGGVVRPPEPIHWRAALTPGLLRLLGVAGVLGLLTVGDGFVYLALLDSAGFAATWFPILYVGTNLAYLALAVPLGRLSDRVGRPRVLVLGHLLLAGSYLASCAAASTAGVLVALALLGAFYAATDGVLAAVAAGTVPAELRTSGIACAQTVVALARMGASVGFGVLWFTIGPHRALVLVAAAVAVAVCAGAPLLWRRAS
ncbi:MFS transporter [Nocardioides sp.]|uniref:MFS transporter n=1 Tax=Nocardioides sp. TaxID=35761 RepID=UPI0039E3FB0D